MLPTERLTTVLTMACISSNRVCARVIKETLCQFLNANIENTIQQQSRRKFLTGTVFTTNPQTRTLNGFSYLTRNFKSGKQALPLIHPCMRGFSSVHTQQPAGPVREIELDIWIYGYMDILLDDDIKYVTQDIRDLIESGTNQPELDTIAKYYLDGQGKALRPMVAMLMARAINYHIHKDNREPMESQRQVAMISEMIHSASLIHDDVIDQSNFRRGKPSVNVLWNHRKVPINEGFFQSGFQSKDQDELNNQPLNNAFEELHLNIGGHLFLNFSHPFISKQMIRIVRFWLNEGVDGFFLTRLHEIQFNQENPEHLIQLLSSIKHQLNLYNTKFTISLDSNDDEDEYLEKKITDKPKKILIASRESLDYLHKRLKKTLIDFWTQETKSNDVKFRNLYPLSLNGNRLTINTTRSNQFNQLNSSIDSLNSLNLDKKTKLTLNQFINHYFQTKIKHSNHRTKTKNFFNIYSYFDLIDIFLDLKLNGSELIRDQINEIYLANNLDDELFKDSSVGNYIVLWSIGDHTKQRLANRLHLNSILVSQFILSILPDSISLFYGDEIGLRNVQSVNTGKFKNGQLVPMAWSSKGLYANFTHSASTNDEFISNKVGLDDSIKSTLINQQNAPCLPLSIEQLTHRNTEKLQEQIQRIQHLLQFRKQYLSAINWNLYANENVHYHKPATESTHQHPPSNNLQNHESNQAKSVYQTYLFHYVNNGELGFERYYHNGKSKRRYVLFANLSNFSRMNDFSDKFYFGTIKVASNIKRLRDFLYLNSLHLDSGEAIIAIIE